MSTKRDELSELKHVVATLIAKHDSLLHLVGTALGRIEEAIRGLKEDEQKRYQELLRDFIRLAANPPRTPTVAQPLNDQVQKLVGLGFFDELPIGHPDGYRVDELEIGGYQESR